MALVCTTPMCSDGRSRVKGMWDTLSSLQYNYPDFNFDSFQPACASIQSELDSVDSWYADMIPFNPVCCTISGIGDKADVLTNQMLSSVGAVHTPIAPKETDWTTIALVGGAILLLVIYSPQIKSIVR